MYMGASELRASADNTAGCAIRKDARPEAPANDTNSPVSTVTASECEQTKGDALGDNHNQQTATPKVNQPDSNPTDSGVIPPSPAQTSEISSLLPCPFCGSGDVDPEGVAAFKPEHRTSDMTWDDARPEHIEHYPACNVCSATTNGNWNTRAIEPVSFDLHSMCRGFEKRKEQLVALANLADAYEAGWKDALHVD